MADEAWGFSWHKFAIRKLLSNLRYYRYLDDNVFRIQYLFINLQNIKGHKSDVQTVILCILDSAKKSNFALSQLHCVVVQRLYFKKSINIIKFDKVTVKKAGLMHNNDIDEQTRELSYPWELKVLHFEQRALAGCRIKTKWTCATSDFSCQTVGMPKVLVCRVKQSSFERNRQSLLSPGVKWLCLQITKALGNRYIPSARLQQHHNLWESFWKLYPVWRLKTRNYR